MTPAQYLAACKVKMGHCSDYALAKAWGIDKGYMSQLRAGKRPLNALIAFHIAITLELDPAVVLADIESQQQSGKNAEFWRSFLLRAKAAAVALLVTLALLASAGFESVQAISGGGLRRRLGVA